MPAPLPSSLAAARLAVILLVALGGAGLSADSRPSRPNIVFIMADDLAWADVGFNGNRFHRTPHLDRIRAGGMRLERLYAGGPNCMPTRACLVSGMYTPRTEMWTPGGRSKGRRAFMKLDVPARGRSGPDPFPSRLALEPAVISLAEVLGSAGYRTARFGKWHLGPDPQGFDVSDPSGRGDPPGSRFYGHVDVHEWLTDAGIRWIRRHRDEPFLLLLSHWDVHTPIRARRGEVARFEERKAALAGWTRDWNTTYAAMIAAVDRSAGRIHDTLAEEGLAEKTLFVFTSDNGGHAGATTNRPLRGAKGSLFEGGIRVPGILSWPGVIAAGSHCRTPVTSVDFLPTFADLAGADLPADQPVDGASLVPLLEGGDLAGRALFWHYPLYLAGAGEGRVLPVHGTREPYWRGVPASVIMRGDWKLMHCFEDDSLRLYDLATDPGETRDLANDRPRVTARLAGQLAAWQAATGAAIPDRPNPAFRPPGP